MQQYYSSNSILYHQLVQRKLVCKNTKNFLLSMNGGTSMLKKLVEDPYVHVILKGLCKKSSVRVSNCCLYYQWHKSVEMCRSSMGFDTQDNNALILPNLNLRSKAIRFKQIFLNLSVNACKRSLIKSQKCSKHVIFFRQLDRTNPCEYIYIVVFKSQGQKCHK